MKTTLILILLLTGCGKGDETQRCRSKEEMAMRCQIAYVEKYKSFEIPAWVQDQCERLYRADGCYFADQEKYYW